MPKMTALTFAATGHLLAALTRTADPEGELDAADLAGDGFPLRSADGVGPTVTFAADDLAAKLVPLLDAALADPTAFAVQGGRAEPQADGSAIDPQLAFDSVKPKLPVSVAEETRVWVAIEGGPDGVHLLREVKIPAGKQEPAQKEPLQLTAPGDYAVAVFAPDYSVHRSVVQLP